MDRATLLAGNTIIRSRAVVQGGVRGISAIAAAALPDRPAGPARIASYRNHARTRSGCRRSGIHSRSGYARIGYRLASVHIRGGLSAHAGHRNHAIPPPVDSAMGLYD